jgi:hypothetical protein
MQNLMMSVINVIVILSSSISFNKKNLNNKIQQLLIIKLKKNHLRKSEKEVRPLNQKPDDL